LETPINAERVIDFPIEYSFQQTVQRLLLAKETIITHDLPADDWEEFHHQIHQVEQVYQVYQVQQVE
jgi:hypothetical protein